MQHSWTRICPVCAGDARLVASLPAHRLRSAMARALGAASSSVPEIRDYRLLGCVICGLEFADPPVEPGESFYAWLVNAGLGYPDVRWEWNACLKDIRAHALPDHEVRLLDVGCGTGRFLGVAGRTGYVRATGIDLNQQVVDECNEQGLDAWQGTLAEWRQKRGEKFQAICLWHVVEHVADPVATLECAAELLDTGGFIYFSVPLTPMSYEGMWPDPFNLPPHHLTRWGIRSLNALAERLGMSAAFLMPEAEPRWRRMLRSMVLASTNRVSGLPRMEKARKLAAYVLRNPGILMSEWNRQGDREKDEQGLTLPDVVLVRLSKRTN